MDSGDQPNRPKRPSMFELAKRKVRILTEDGQFDPLFLKRSVEHEKARLQKSEVKILNPVSNPDATSRVLETGTKYASKIKEKAQNKAIDIILGKVQPLSYEHIEPTELMEEADEHELSEAEEQPVLQHQSQLQSSLKLDETRQGLPIVEHRDEIMKKINSSRVTIIEGCTGSGKSTQVPLYIYQDALSKNQRVNIIVTQPRRIAAVSVSKYVASLLHTDLGDTVGYQIGLSRKHSGLKTKILFCTVGVLLQKIIHWKGLSYLTHIIIDEVHERDTDTDLLLMMVRKFVWETNLQQIKIILMSASFNTTSFADYFTLPCLNSAYSHLTAARIHKIDAKQDMLYTFYLERVEKIAKNNSSRKDLEVPTSYEFKKSEPLLIPSLYKVCCFLIQDCFSAVPHDIRLSNSKPVAEPPRKTILIFLPGLFEIEQLYSEIKSMPESDSYHILKLHSSLDDSVQHEIFGRKETDRPRRIILSTNIAESSITVPDVSHVIDFCLTKINCIDETTELPILRLQWVSKANAIQRAGRAGRITRGCAFRLIPQAFYECLPQYPVPEICRCPLDLAVLRVKILNFDNPKKLLASCLDPPPLEHIRSAVLKLKRLGALTVKNNEGYTKDEDGDITALGRIMSALPIDVSSSKLICLGYAVGLLEDCVNIAAGLATQDLFNPDYDINGYKTRFDLSKRSHCDLITLNNIIQEATNFNTRVSNHPRRNQQMKDWAQFNNINFKRLMEVTLLRDEIMERLKRLGMQSDAESSIDDVSQKELLLKCIFAGSFYPNYFLRKPINQDSIEKNEINPYTSVVFGRMPNGAPLYAKQIANLFKNVCDIRQLQMRFMSSKAIVIFPEVDYCNEESNVVAKEGAIANTPQQDVPRSVYLALMMKYFTSMEINTLTEPKDIVYKMKILLPGRLNTERIHFNFANCQSIPRHLPVNQTLKTIRVKITHIEKCGHFWVQVSPKDTACFSDVRESLENVALEKLSVQETYSLMPVIYETDVFGRKRRSRAVLLAFHNLTSDATKDQSANRVFIRLIDTGQTLWTNIESLFLMNVPHHLQAILRAPALALECKLINIMPSCLSSTWSKEASDYFSQVMKPVQEDVELEVYSHDNGICRVSVRNIPCCEKMDLSSLLIQLGYAEFCAESHISSTDHWRRERFQSMKNMDRVVFGGEEIKGSGQAPLSCSFLDDFQPIQPDQEKLLDRHKVPNGRVIKLAGPSNPLEINFHGLCSSYETNIARIDRKSVNAIVLEPDISQGKSRMMVAPVCLMKPSGITATKTSLMPYIRGFASLMQMLFAPCVELHFDPQFNCYTGALSGLGVKTTQSDHSSSSHSAHDEEFDIELPFDAYFTSHDLLQIRIVRYLLSKLLLNTCVIMKGSKATPEISDPVPIRKRIRLCLLSLLSINRFPLPDYNPNRCFGAKQWKNHKPSFQAKKDAMQFGNLLKPFLPDIPEPAAVNPTLSSIKERLNELEAQCPDNENASTFCPVCGDMITTHSFMTHQARSEKHQIQKMLFDRHFSKEVEEQEKLQQEWDKNEAEIIVPHNDDDDDDDDVMSIDE